MNPGEKLLIPTTVSDEATYKNLYDDALVRRCIRGYGVEWYLDQSDYGVWHAPGGGWWIIAWLHMEASATPREFYYADVLSGPFPSFKTARAAYKLIHS